MSARQFGRGEWQHTAADGDGARHFHGAEQGVDAALAGDAIVVEKNHMGCARKVGTHVPRRRAAGIETRFSDAEGAEKRLAVIAETAIAVVDQDDFDVAAADLRSNAGEALLDPRMITMADHDDAGFGRLDRASEVS